jgi:asparagine synthase (glutamine-hydrolysing)
VNDAYYGTFESASEELARAIAGSVESSIRGTSKVAVAFSGGLDSSILVACAQRHAKVIACTAAAGKSRDERMAPAAAKALGVELFVEMLAPELVELESQNLNFPFGATPMDKSLWCLYSVVSRKAAAEGAGVILLGQLSDELFGGYAKYEKAIRTGGDEAARALMEKDVAGYATRGRLRDYEACSRWLPPRFPFEADEVVSLGLSFPVSFKIRDGERKSVLRRAAGLLGLPEGLSSAPKKAAQYSSGIQKILR